MLPYLGVRPNETQIALELVEHGASLFVLDPDYRIVFVNAAFEQSSGTSRAELVGKVFWDLYPDAARPESRFREGYRRALQQRVGVEFEEFYRPQDRWYAVNAVPMRFGGIAVYFRDITAQKRIEEALRRSEENARAHAAELQAVLDAVPAAVFITRDPESRRMEANRFFTRTVELPDGANVSKSAPDAGTRLGFRVMRDGREIPKEELPVQRAARGEDIRGYEYDLVFRDGQVRHMIGNATPLRDPAGQPSGSVGAFVDITEHKRTEAGLREAEARLRALVSATSDVVYRMSPDWSEMRQLRGREILADTDEPTTRWLDRYIHPEDHPRVEVAIAAAVRSRSVFQLEHRVVRSDGSVGWTLSRAVPMLDADGAIVEWIGAATDITPRKRAEEALRESEERARARAAELEAVLDTVPAAVWISRDPRGDRIDANRFGSEILRQRPGENVSVTSPGEDRPRHFTVQRDGRVLEPDELAIQRAARRGEEIRGMEVEIVFEDGEVRHLLGNASPLRDLGGSVRGSVGAFIDITARRAAEEELRDADRRKNEFLAVLSHELRNPLAPIRNSVFLLEKLPTESAQAARARLVLRRQTEHLARLVEDLLDVTRISRGKIQLQREVLDLRALVQKTCDDHGATDAADVEVTIELPAVPVWVDVDPTRIAQVVGNLVTNAIKFTPRGGTVTVRLRAHDGAAEIAVQDTGIGIAPEQLSRMFQPFAQEDRSLARSRGGLGLGLALSKGLVEAHGGSIAAHSDGPGKGSRFAVTLSLAHRPAEILRAEEPALLPRGARRRVLLIDDNADAARTLADVLELIGHEVTIAPDGPTGLARARALRPDIVLCDLGLPYMNGYEVARALRQDDALRSTRLIALSGYGYPDDKQRAYEAGFEAHFTRPAGLDELAAALR